jgi:uncharacterized paraquat-inducible protein A
MGPVVWVVLVAAVLLLVAGGYFWLRARPAAKDQRAYYFNCPGCRQRLRYHARQAGHAGQCPRCRQPLTFPRDPS